MLLVWVFRKAGGVSQTGHLYGKSIGKWVGPKVGRAESQRINRVGQQCVSQVDGDLYMDPACQVCRGQLSKRTMASASTWVWEKAVPPPPPAPILMPDTLVPSYIPWCPLSCCPSARTWSKWVRISLCTGPLREMSGPSSPLSHSVTILLVFTARYYWEFSYLHWTLGRGN